MTNEISPHDKFFKSIISDLSVAKEFLQINLPEDIKNIVDLNTLKIQKDSFIDNHLKTQFVDLLFATNFHQEKGYIYLLFEHLSNPDKLISFRLIKYVLQIIDRHLKQNNTKKLPIVYPILFYTGKQHYNYSTNIFDLFEEHKKLAKNIFLHPIKFIDVKNVADDNAIKNLQLALMIKTFKYVFEESEKLFQIIIEDLKRADKNGDFDLINIVVKYISIVHKFEQHDDFFENLAENLSEKSGDNVMTIAEHYIFKGEQKGKQKGKEKAYKQVISNLQQNGFHPEKIAKLIGLPKEKVKNYLSETLDKKSN
jgi:recombination-promoting nuclease RpnB